MATGDAFEERSGNADNVVDQFRTNCEGKDPSRMSPVSIKSNRILARSFQIRKSLETLSILINNNNEPSASSPGVSPLMELPIRDCDDCNH